MGLLSRRNEKDEAKYRTKVKTEHDRKVADAEYEKKVRQITQDRIAKRDAAAKARIDARLERTRQVKKIRAENKKQQAKKAREEELRKRRNKRNSENRRNGWW